jgi:hypothetical protein
MLSKYMNYGNWFGSSTLGHRFMEPGDYQDAPVSKILLFIRSVGLLEGWNKGMHNRPFMVVVQGPV